MFSSFYRKQAEIDASKAPQVLTIEHDEAEEVSGNEISTDDDERDFGNTDYDSASITPASSRENSAGVTCSLLLFAQYSGCAVFTLIVVPLRYSSQIAHL